MNKTEKYRNYHVVKMFMQIMSEFLKNILNEDIAQKLQVCPTPILNGKIRCNL